LLRRVQCQPFPDFSAPIRPSDSLSFFGRRSGLPSLHGPPLVGDFFCAVPSPVVPAGRVPCGARRVGALLSGAPYPSFQWKGEGLPGYWVVPLLRAVVRDPAGCSDDLAHIDAVGAAAFEPKEAIGSRNVAISGLYSHGPSARVPTHRRGCHQPRRKTRFRPAGLSFDRSGLSPAGRLTEFPGLPHGHSFPTSIAWSHPIASVPAEPRFSRSRPRGDHSKRSTHKSIASGAAPGPLLLR
jgi:hypothetical protein